MDKQWDSQSGVKKRTKEEEEKKKNMCSKMFLEWKQIIFELETKC